MRSLIAAPLLDSSGSLGMIVLSSRIHVRRFAEQDLELLTALGSVAALRIRNLVAGRGGRRAAASSRRRWRSPARSSSRSCPSSLPEIPGYSVFATNDASRAVSGDFYEFQGRDEGDEQVIVIADVSGKGMAASLLAASFDALLMGPIEVGHPTDLICAKVSRRLFMKTPPERYVTAFIAALDPGTGRALLHERRPQPRAPGAGRRDACSGSRRTGCRSASSPWSSTSGSRSPSRPGDLVVLYTDGHHRGGEPEGRRVRPRAAAGGRAEVRRRSRSWPSRWPSRPRSRCSPTARRSATTARS